MNKETKDLLKEINEKDIDEKTNKQVEKLENDLKKKGTTLEEIFSDTKGMKRYFKQERKKIKDKKWLERQIRIAEKLS